MQRLGGVGHIFTCTEINFHPIVKPFEMGGYWSVMKRPIFCLTIGCLKVEILDNFQKSLTKNGLLRSQIQSKKNFEKIQKNDENFFSLFLFLLCSIECIMFPRLDLMTQNQFYTRYIVKTFVKYRYENDVIIYKNIEKFFDIFCTF